MISLSCNRRGSSHKATKGDKSQNEPEVAVWKNAKTKMGKTSVLATAQVQRDESYIKGEKAFVSSFLATVML